MSDEQPDESIYYHQLDGLEKNPVQGPWSETGDFTSEQTEGKKKYEVFQERRHYFNQVLLTKVRRIFASLRGRVDEDEAMTELEMRLQDLTEVVLESEVAE